MAQKQYVEKPVKVLAEQFDPAAAPPTVGACFCNLSFPYVATGHPPHVHIVAPAAAVVFLTASDWIVCNRWTGAPEAVLTNAQFQETYGNQPGEAEA